MRKLACLVVFLIALCPVPASADEALPPNVLLIVADDERSDGMQVMHSTERIFGKGGTEYPNAFVTTPLCCPSRSSILTGQYVHNTGVWDNASATKFDPRASWPVALQDAGYETGLFGKYLNHWDGSIPGFDTAALTSGEGDPRRDGVLARRAIRFTTEAPEPWALIYAPAAPHAPWTPLARDRGTDVGTLDWNPAFDEDPADKAPIVQESAEYRNWGRRWQLQRLELLALDRRAGRLAGAAPAKTLAIYTSDNGYLFGEHGLSAKLWPYRDTVHVPLYLRGPGVPADEVDERLVANVDIAPTIYEATGVTPAVPQDGRSLLSGDEREWLLLEGPTGRLLADNAWEPWTAYQSMARHYVHWDSGWIEDYDLSGDPYEIAAANEADPKLDALLGDAADCVGDECP